MPTYRVTDKSGTEINPGDTVTDFRGDTATFEEVTRGVEYNGTAKVVADGNEFYAQVFDLTVVTLPDNDPAADVKVCRYNSMHMMNAVPAVTTIESGIGTVDACQGCADFYASHR